MHIFLWDFLAQVTPAPPSISVSDNIIVAFLGLISAITVAFITSSRRANAEHKATSRYKGTSADIRELKRQVRELQEAEETCRRALTAVLTEMTKMQGDGR